MKKKTLTFILCIALVMTGFAACAPSEPAEDAEAGTPDTAQEAGATVAERFDFDPTAPVNNTPHVAVLEGNWYEMGYQLGEQFPQELATSTAHNVSMQIEKWGSYEAALEVYQSYLALTNEYMVHPEDGAYTDMIQGTADSTGMAYNDVMMLYIKATSDIPAGTPLGEEPQNADGESDSETCSWVMSWGEANARGEGVIAAQNTDLPYSWDVLQLPTIVAFPTHGNAFIMQRSNGLFGEFINEAGLVVCGAGGAWDGVDNHFRIGVKPQAFLAAYCSTTQDVIDFLGDPETTPREDWWPISIDTNFAIGDASGDVCSFEITATDRAIRRNGDIKYLGQTAAGDVTLTDETSPAYLVGNNFLCTETMYYGSRANPENGLDILWPDVLARYWTVEKYLQDAIAAGGVTVDTLREAQGSHSYYIPEGWDFDAFPDYDYYGFWVPATIYEGFADGSISRADYYGESYDLEGWGEAMLLADSRRAKEWSPGWHNNLVDGWTWNLDISYWAPEPQTPDFKTTVREIFDSNSLTLYTIHGSADNGTSVYPENTGTYTKIQFDVRGYADENGGDKALAMVDNMMNDVHYQLWFTPRDMAERGVELNTADGQIIYGYLDEAKQQNYEGMSFRTLGIIATSQNEKLAYYSKAMTAFAKAQCYAQMAQTKPVTLRKDFGIVEPTLVD